MNAIACANCGRENPSEASFCTRCGVSVLKPNAGTAGSNLTPGIRLRDRYTIQYLLGRGGFSRTYLAEDTGRFNEQVVLKQLILANQETHTLQKAEELFQREAAMLHQLQHPQIPRFWEFFRDGTRLFLVQDYIEGKTYQSVLEDRIAAGQTFSEAEIIQLLQKLLPVLSYLHSFGVIHRDISPDNIICRASDGLPVLIDLGGVTKVTVVVTTSFFSSQNSAVAGSTTRLGKIGYAPDEQLRLGIAAPHSDLYALGVTTLVLMTGKQPQELIDLETMQWNWQQDLSLSPILTRILNRMLASQPVERFQSAKELLHQLETHSDTTLTLTQVYSPPAQDDDKAPHLAPTPANNSGQGQLFDSSIPVPEEIHGWNWGAFFIPGVWCIPNRVWIGLISWADLSLITLPLTLGTMWPIMAVVLGVKGNEWAWKSRRWKSIREFKRHQRLWAIAGFLIVTTILILLALLVFILLALGMSVFGLGGTN